MQNTDYITRNEAAKILGVSAQTVSNWHEEGRLPGEMRGRGLFLSRKAVNKLNDALNNYKVNKEWIESLENEQKKIIEDYKKSINDYLEAATLFKEKSGFWIKYRFLISILKIEDKNTNLSPREIQILEDVLYGDTLEVISDRYELTRERIRQIIEKALRKFRNYTSYSELYEENRKLKTELESLKAVKELVNRKKKKVGVEFLNTKLHDLGISVRSITCLKSVGIETPLDLLKYPKEDLLKIRNFGKKSYRELEDFLYTNGFSFDSDIDDVFSKITEGIADQIDPK